MLWWTAKDVRDCSIDLELARRTNVCRLSRAWISCETVHHFAASLPMRPTLSSYLSEIFRSSWLRTTRKENSTQAMAAPIAPNEPNIAICCHTVADASDTGEANK